MAEEPRRIALVTGASRGLGRAAALALARSGVHVVAVARTVGGLEELDDEIRAAGGSATLVPLDLTDSPAIDRLGAELHQRWGRLDALFGNAGVLGLVTPVSHLDPKVWESAFAVNLTANWRLIRAFDPLLRLSPAGRALFVTTGAPRFLRPYFGVYSASKAALEALVMTYAREVQATTVKANLLVPGRMATAMSAQAYPGLPAETMPSAETPVPAVLRLLAADCTDNGTIFSVPEGRTILTLPPLPPGG